MTVRFQKMVLDTNVLKLIQLNTISSRTVLTPVGPDVRDRGYSHHVAADHKHIQCNWCGPNHYRERYAVIYLRRSLQGACKS